MTPLSDCFQDFYFALASCAYHLTCPKSVQMANIIHSKADTITDFLNSRKQRVILNTQFSSWTSIKAGAPQGLILGPLFLIYINDLSDDLITNTKVSKV